MAQPGVAITTIDNPYDPYENFDDWYRYDMDKGYDSCGYLARIARTADGFTDDEYWKEINRAIDEIIKLDFRHIYRKIVYGN